MSDKLKAVYEFPLVLIVTVGLYTVLIIAIISDALYWLFWHTIGSIWITLSTRYEFRDWHSDNKLSQWLFILGVTK